MTNWLITLAAVGIAVWLLSRGRGQRFATAAQRRALRRKQRGLCWVCSRPLGADGEAHHVIAWSKGGKTRLGNLRLVHRDPCHHALTVAEFGHRPRGRRG